MKNMNDDGKARQRFHRIGYGTGLAHSAGGFALLLTLFCSGLTQAATNTILFTYTNRAALLNDGWSYIATLPGGAQRNTEVTTGNVVSYDQTVHPGVLRIPCDQGDLWGSLNNTRNSLFRSLSTNWTSLRLQVTFSPTANGQQAQLAVYQDDDNYVEVGHAFNGGELVALTREDGGNQPSWSPLNVSHAPVAAGTVFLRLDRDINTDQLSAFYSLNGTNWATVGRHYPSLGQPAIVHLDRRLARRPPQLRLDPPGHHYQRYTGWTTARSAATAPRLQHSRRPAGYQPAAVACLFPPGNTCCLHRVQQCPLVVGQSADWGHSQFL